MARAVSPWTWRRALRDCAPRKPGLRLTLLTIGTYMDRDGFAFPGQTTLAADTCASIKTVRRHIQEAQRLGWISVENAGRPGQAWRHYVYRACVPDQIILDDDEERISDAIISINGDVQAGVAAMSPPSTTKRCERGDIREPNVGTFDPEGGVCGVQKVGTQLRPTNSGSETLALRTHAPEEAHALCASVPWPSSTLGDKPAEEAATNQPSAVHPATAKKVLQEAVHAAMQPSSRLRVISDAVLWDRTRKYQQAGVNAIADISKALAGAYSDVGIDRLRRIIRENDTRKLVV